MIMVPVTVLLQVVTAASFTSYLLEIILYDRVEHVTFELLLLLRISNATLVA
jgi:hypothetical protein